MTAEPVQADSFMLRLADLKFRESKVLDVLVELGGSGFLDTVAQIASDNSKWTPAEIKEGVFFSEMWGVLEVDADDIVRLPGV